MTGIVDGGGEGRNARIAISLHGGRRAIETTTTIDYAGAMKTLRQRTSTLVPPPRTSSTRAAFDDILEIMDEIQEAMDTAEETESGLRSLGEMKANEMRKRDGRATMTNDDE